MFVWLIGRNEMKYDFMIVFFIHLQLSYKIIYMKEEEEENKKEYLYLFFFNLVDFRINKNFIHKFLTTK